MDFDVWRLKARDLLANNTAPESVGDFGDSEQTGFQLFDEPTPAPQSKFLVDREFVKAAELASCARDPDRWRLLYRLLYRLKNENPNLMKVSIDRDVLRICGLAKSVARDLHKMHAFVRFKRVVFEGGERFMAWHAPDHLIMKLAAPFFERRFGDKPWSICTPDLSAHWDLQVLTYSPGIPSHEFPHTDQMDEIWKTYYGSIFNPSRVNIKAMQSEMPQKYWTKLPEAEIIRSLLREAPQRLAQMAAKQTLKADVPAHLSIGELRAKAAICNACPLAAHATQTVFGSGPDNARLMIIGEQPGDQEDLQGKAFVGPAGEVLGAALTQADLNRDSIYVTNAVKHFKWKPSGKTRLHQKPSGAEMHACKPWLDAEIEQIQPKLIVLLGATAATAWLGRLPKIAEERGQVITSLIGGPAALISWHPSAILRASDEAQREQRFEELRRDLQTAREWLERN